MFGRKKKDAPLAQDARAEDELLDQPIDDDLDEDGVDDRAEAEDVDDASDVEDLGDDDEDDEDQAPVRDEWDELDESQDWRDDGPFDVEEVDLDDDPVNRIDFGTLVLTPFDGMNLQLQVDQSTGAVQTALVIKDNSALEVALFAAPRSGGLAKTVRGEMLEQAGQAGGQAQLAEGPFGTEVHRVVPIQTPDGQQAAHVSRTWLAEGPRWLLRGVLMGEVALGAVGGEAADDRDFVEFFKNVIVKRGNAAMPQGELIAMQLPEELKQAEPEQLP